MNLHRRRKTNAFLTALLCWSLLSGAPGFESLAQAAQAQVEGPGGAISRGKPPARSPVQLGVALDTVPRLGAAAAPGAIAPTTGGPSAAEGQPLAGLDSRDARQAAPSKRALEVNGGQLARADSPSAVSRLLSRMFGERAAADPSTISDDRIRFYIAEQGQPTISGRLSELRETLKRHPEVAARLNIVRLATAKKDKVQPHDGLVPQDAARILAAVDAQGVKAKLEVERVPVDWTRHRERQARKGGGAVSVREEKPFRERLRDVAAHPLRAGWRAVTWPARQVLFVVRTYLASVSSPTRQELVGAALTKIPPFIIGVGIWWKTIGPSHPVLLASAILLSAAWEAFHGVLLNSWNSFQNSLYKLRGGTYQTNFNWAYGQLNPAIFRIMSWSVKPDDPARVPPWRLRYWFANWNPLTVAFWFAMAPISVFGTFIGTLAYRGLNTLYETGRLTRGWRSGIQQGRDFVMMLTGFLLGAGMAKYYVLLFLVQQAFDVAAYVVSLRAKGRPVLYVTDDIVADTKEFNELYPVAPNPVVEPPLAQALKALGDIPLLYPITLPIKLGRRLWAKRRKT